ncbi:MAG TPA: hypothetical protein VGH87_06155, partial [Polyangiaceae bacterium]
MGDVLLQVTVRWGPDVIGVWRVESRVGFTFDDVVVVPPSETWSEDHARPAIYRASGASTDVAFEIDTLREPRWARTHGEWRVATALAALFTLALHAGFAFAAMHATPPSEETASAEHVAYMTRVLYEIATREQEEEEPDGPCDPFQGCMGASISKVWPRRWSFDNDDGVMLQ